MKTSRIRTESLFLVFALLALVISIGLTFVTLSTTKPKNEKMTSACAHNPASHLRTRIDRDVLPTNVIPVNYDLVIKPDMDNFTFEGKVSIE
jgi:hypothetical protein